MSEGGNAVLVTGAGSGIGAAAARAFSRRGNPVVVGDIVEESLHAVEESIREIGGEILAASVDVRDPGSVHRLVMAGADRFGGYATVCANAGTNFPEMQLASTPDDVIDDLLNVNLRGVIFTARATLPHIQEHGSIIMTSSTSGLVADPGWAVYAATKAAIVGLTRSLAAELSPRRIRVNAICPGSVDTPLHRRVASPEEFRLSAEQNPLGRMAVPEDIAEAMVFLASPAARHVNGITLRIDGGESLQVGV